MALVPRAGQSGPDQTDDLAGQTLISDQGPSVGAGFLRSGPLQGESAGTGSH